MMADRLTGILTRRAQVEAARSAETETASTPAKATEAEATPTIGEGITNAPPVSAAQAEAAEPTAQPPKHKGGRPRASGETKTARITLNLKPSMMAEIERIASTRDTTPTTLVYEVVRDWLTANNSE